MSGNVLSGNTLTCDDLRSYSAAIVKCGSCNNLRGGWAGGNEDCNIQITSHSKLTSQDFNTKNYLRAHMAWVTGNASTLAFTGVDNTAERSIAEAGGNVKIQGIAEPGAGNDLANKAYADSKLSTYFNMNNPAKALVIVQLSNLSGWAPNANGLTFNINSGGPFSSPSTGGSGVGTVDVDGITLTASNDGGSDQRLLIVNASGGAHVVYNAAAMNGVYILTNVSGAGLLTFTRSDDLNTIAVSPSNVGVQRGDYVLVSNSSATHHGMGFFLNSEPSTFGNADGPTTNQDWVQFAAHTVANFGTPIENDADTVSIRGATNGDDEGRVITAGAGGTGQAGLADRMGRSDADFIVQATNLTVGESGTTATFATSMTTMNIPDLAAPGLSGGTPNVIIDAGLELKLDGTGHVNSFFQDNAMVASSSTGSIPQVITPAGVATFAYDTIDDIGAVNIQTEGYDQAVTGFECGVGILFDAVTIPNGFTGNDNEGRFYMSAYKMPGVAADECRFSIFNFQDSGSGATANQANPLVTFT